MIRKPGGNSPGLATSPAGGVLPVFPRIKRPALGQRPMQSKKYRHLFGPVPSRRFGRSLGVDLSPPKTCTLNCIFCQLGRTTHLTAQRSEFIPTNEVLSELAEWFEEGIQADYVTLSGSGEPTLHTGFGSVLSFARENSRYRVAVLTNGTLLHIPDVRAACRPAHVVKVSLGAWDEDSFQALNQPHPDITFKKLLAGEIALREEYDGEIWLEVFVVKGINSKPDQIRRIAELSTRIRPDKIHLNTAVRPPAHTQIEPVPEDHLRSLAQLFPSRAEVIAPYAGGSAAGVPGDTELIMDTIRRRPCTAAQLAAVFGMHPNEVSKHLAILLKRGAVRADKRGDTVYFIATDLPRSD